MPPHVERHKYGDDAMMCVTRADLAIGLSPIGVLAAVCLGVELGNAIRRWKERSNGS